MVEVEQKGMFEGDMIDGELEIGQAASQVNTILPAKEIVNQILEEFKWAKNDISTISF